MTDAAPALGAATDAARIRHGWFVAGVMFLALLLVFGARFSMGLFLPFLPEALGVLTRHTAGVHLPLLSLRANFLTIREVAIRLPFREKPQR
ncbi:MAG: hypothetical protein ACO21B_12030, partial [Gemmobacter sp.]